MFLPPVRYLRSSWFKMFLALLGFSVNSFHAIGASINEEQIFSMKDLARATGYSSLDM